MQGELRRCYACGEMKPLDRFVKNRSKPLGRGHRCGICAGRAKAARRKTPLARARKAEYQRLRRKAEARGLRRAAEYVRQVAPVGGYVLKELERFARETEQAIGAIPEAKEKA